MPWKPSRSSTRLSSAGTRTDLEATRIGVPPARRSRSSALASKASRSTTISGVGGGASRAATASPRRDHSRLRSMLWLGWWSALMLWGRSRDAALAEQRLDLGHLRVHGIDHGLGLPGPALGQRLVRGGGVVGTPAVAGRGPDLAAGEH